ncbi:MAG: TVP38/TMEM64 family protein [Leptolyngbyaceae cyanobacterium bins.349]|nr:TVP38/TMEM64 family protein [Leptolyngbyaceae cyanobacterium bins.349]
MQTKHSYRVISWLGLFLVAVVGICLYSPARMLFDDALLTAVFRQLGGFAPFCFVLLFTVALSLGFPGNVLAVVGGAVFGIIWGTVWSLIGSTLGAMGAFALARYLLQRRFAHYFGHHPLLQRLNRAIARYPFTIVLATRFTPLSPFSLVNFLFGLTSIDLKTYAVGTFLGLLPLTLAYSWLGVSGYAAFQGGDRLSVYLALGFLAFLSALPMLMRKASR